MSFRRTIPLALLCTFALGGCAGTGGQGGRNDQGASPDPWFGIGPAPRAAQPRHASGDGPGDPNLVHVALEPAVSDLPKSRSGNAPFYTVFGRRYGVLESAADFHEEGVASWYGAKFHGRPTASGEPYDMHAMSAAHKFLPLPTFVRVTRTDTGASVVVKVNDRGPFVDDRIVDLSYAAAARLDMLDNGTAPVRIDGLSSHVDAEAGSGTAAAEPGPGEPYWIQVGAYREDGNARRALARAAEGVSLPGRIEHDAAAALYRVRFGPVSDADVLAAATDALADLGFDSYTMVPAAP